jgi:DNA-directed RNA polymerase subunit RPC12/RpoP
METKPKIIKCKDCGKDFEIIKKTRYIRKYCDKCSIKRKKDYENLFTVKFEECDDD